jgi:drug/metabolite transporter (DMT)-like permease
LRASWEFEDLDVVGGTLRRWRSKRCRFTASSARVSMRRLLLAVTSGGVTSGLGYAIWYRALRGLTATQAAILQLSVPIIAAFGAVAILHETLTARLAVATLAVLGRVSLVIFDRSPRR